MNRLKIKADNTNEGNIHLNLAKDDFKLEVTAAKKEGELPRFKIHAYTGKVIGQPWGRVIVDGTGIKLREVVKILMDHNPSLPIGHTDKITAHKDGNVFLEGIVSGNNKAEYITNFLESSKNNFPWESSIGADVVRSEYLEAGETAIVNGIEVQGPMTIARESLIYETSVVTFGADSDTTAMAAGKHAPTFSHHVQGEHMKFITWLKANGYDIATLSDDEKKLLQAQFDAAQAVEASGVKPNTPATPVAEPVKAAAPVAAPAATPESVTALQKQMTEIQASTANATRIAGITTICAGKHEDLQKVAIDGNWSVEATQASLDEIAKIEASRPAPVAHVNSSKPASVRSVVAGAIMSNGVKAEDLKGKFTDEDIDAGTSIKCYSFSDLSDLLLAAKGVNTTGMSAMQKIEAGFTTNDLPKALGDLANTSLMAGYTDPADTIGAIARMATVKNFKKNTKLQMNADMVLKEVGPTGDIEHAQLGEDSYEMQVKQHARQLVISRPELIDDELDVFTDFFNGFGRGASLAELLKFWKLFTDAQNQGFFSLANGNLLTNVLSIDGLTAANTLLANQVDEWGMPIVITKKNLIVPTSLGEYAKQLVSSQVIAPVYNNATKEPVNNPHVGQYNVIESQWLNNDNVGNKSATAWYITADSDDVAAFASVHRQGMNGPEIRSESLPVGKLGMASDAVYDFGAAYINPKGAVKSTGTP